MAAKLTGARRRALVVLAHGHPGGIRASLVSGQLGGTTRQAHSQLQRLTEAGHLRRVRQGVYAVAERKNDG